MGVAFLLGGLLAALHLVVVEGVLFARILLLGPPVLVHEVGSGLLRADPHRRENLGDSLGRCQTFRPALGPIRVLVDESKKKLVHLGHVFVRVSNVPQGA